MICGSAEFIESVVRAGDLEEGGYVPLKGGEVCRRYVTQSACGLLVIGPRLVDVSPLNLVAAVAKDKKERDVEGSMSRPDVILCCDGMAGSSYVSRALSAGAKQVVQLDELRQIFRNTKVFESTGNFQRAKNSDSRDQLGKTIIFTGGVGGCGKTTLALLSAVGLARSGIKVGLVDFDLQFGDLAFLLGLDDAHTLYETVTDITHTINAETIRSLVHPISGEVEFIAAPRRPEQAEAVVPHTREVLAACRSLFDVTVVDAGDYWGDCIAELLCWADDVVIVCDGRASGLHESGRAAELCVRLGVPIVKIHAVVNRRESRRNADDLSAAFALKGATVSTLPEGGREVDELIGLGCPEELFSLRNPLAVETANLACRMLKVRDGRAIQDGAESGEGDKGLHLPLLRRRRYV